MTVTALLRRFRWPLALAGGVAAAAGAGTFVGNTTAAGMDQFYANAAAASATRLAQVEAPPADDPGIVIDNEMPPVAPVDLSFARATNTATGEDQGDLWQ